jgi:hypothetical protein
VGVPGTQFSKAFQVVSLVLNSFRGVLTRTSCLDGGSLLWACISSALWACSRLVFGLSGRTQAGLLGSETEEGSGFVVQASSGFLSLIFPPCSSWQESPQLEKPPACPSVPSFPVQHHPSPSPQSKECGSRTL